MLRCMKLEHCINLMYMPHKERLLIFGLGVFFCPFWPLDVFVFIVSKTASLRVKLCFVWLNDTKYSEVLQCISRCCNVLSLDRV